MIARIFKSRQPGIFVAIIIFILLSRIPLIIKPLPIEAPLYSSVLYTQTLKLLQDFPIIALSISTILIIFQALIFNNLIDEFNLGAKNTYLPALFYVFIWSFNVQDMQLNPVLLSNLFILFAFSSILLVFTVEQKITPAFNAGFFISIASLFYIPSVYLLFYLWITLIIFRESSLRIYLVVFTGLIIPYLYLFTYYFWVDRLYIELIQIKTLFLRNNITSIQTWQDIFTIIIFGITLLISFLQYWLKINEKLVKIRKYFYSTLWLMLILSAGMIFSWTNKQIHIALISIPASIFIANYVFLCRKNWLANSIILLFMLIIMIELFFYL